MKIRMEENSLRLRLKQKEVEEFYNKGKISSKIKLGVHPESFIGFSLYKDAIVQAVQYSFEANEMKIRVPAKLAESWATTKAEGFEAVVPLEANEHLHILVEKDFKCLHKGPNCKEDEDSFPHPLENKKR